MNQMENATKRQLLQVVPINIVVLGGIIITAVGLYWKFDARITTLENNPKFGMTIEEKAALLSRVTESEKEIKELGPKIIETHTNVFWLMNQQKAAHPQSP